MEGKGKLVMGARRALLHELRGKIIGIDDSVRIVDDYGYRIIRNEDFLLERKLTRIFADLLKELQKKRLELSKLLEQGEAEDIQSQS
jgi:hypothetical protein